MNRREFSKTVGLGTVGLAAAMGGGTTFAASAPKTSALPARVERKNRKEWAKEHFKGFENILIASFTPDLKNLDEAGIRLDVRQSIAHGFFSTLCAHPALSPEETKRFVEIAVDEAAGRITVGLALSGKSQAEMLDIMADVEKAGCQHILIDLPREGSAEDLINYARGLTRATNMGAYLWMAGVHNFTRFHPNGIPYEVFDALADEPNIIALKAGNMDPAVIFELLQRYNERMLVGVLTPALMPLSIRGFGQQWSGAWTVEALQSPEKPYAVEFFNLMMAGKYDSGMKLYWEHVAPGFGMMMKLLGKNMATGGHPWEFFKYYQFLTGGNGGRYRVDPEYPDQPHVTAEDMAAVKAGYRMIGVPTTTLADTAFPVGRINYEKGMRDPAAS